MTLSTTMMYGRGNRTVFDIPLTWDRAQFETTRSKCRHARKLVQTSINVQFKKQFRNVFCQNIEIEKNIAHSNERLSKYDGKVRVLDNMIEMASESLTCYFDKRMENVRNAVHEHCNAIQQIIREETEHWQEIHAVIDQNLLIPNEVRLQAEEKSQSSDQPSTAEVRETTLTALDATTATSLLTQIIRKSRVQSQRFSTAPPPPTPVEVDISAHVEDRAAVNQERCKSVVLPLSAARQPLPVVDTTFVVKHDESRVNNGANLTHRATIDHLPEPEQSPIYSQPNAPPRLYFSPTLLQEEEEEEEPDIINMVLSPVDQNRTNARKTKPDIRRFGQTFLLDTVKTEKIKEDTENVRPKIIDDDEILFPIETKPESPSKIQSPMNIVISNDDHSDTLTKSIVTRKIRPRTRATTKVETKPIIVTTRTTRRAKQPGKQSPEIPNVNKRETRKRKQSIAMENQEEPLNELDEKSTASRAKKRAGPSGKKKPPIAIKRENTRKRKLKKAFDNDKEETESRDPSPMLIIDRIKHYGTRFSTRSHRFNNLTLSATVMPNGESDDENNETRYTLIRQPRSTIAKSRLRTKSTGQNASRQMHDNEIEAILTVPATVKAKNPRKRVQSTATKKNRKK